MTAAEERARIRKAQEGPISNLRRIWRPECDGEEYGGDCKGNDHAAECQRGDFERELRWLEDATKPVKP